MNYPHSETTRTLDRKRWWALFVLLLGTFMVILDSFIVTVANPTIQEQLHASTTQIQFIVASYVLSYAVLLIAGARLGDWQGRKRMFLVGMGIFIVASALCGIPMSGGFLIFSRVIQGIGAAILIPQVLKETPSVLKWGATLLIKKQKKELNTKSYHVNDSQS
ncbi:MFS transporter [Brevibacillus sp. Leaf182]|uniref:MFS transporter n=1 Tax=Brevibacillus sp. Leaf182 TaxID=1736290 RepID=UPI0006FB1329|nr:MFS transporter [Brevibacillus sp. Leaf182]RAT94868.1 MFS transporter [Brevibacillus sp. Leaf182]